MHNHWIERMKLFKQIGKVTGREHEANELVDETKHNVEKVIKSVPRHHRCNLFYGSIF